MQSDEKTISALTAQAHNAEADKRTLQKKLAASERRVQDLEKRLADQQAASDDKIRELTDKLSLEMAKVSDMIQQLVSYMTGKGDVSLAGTIHETVVAGIREEVRKEMRQEEFAYIYNNTEQHQFYSAFDQITRYLVFRIYDPDAHGKHEDRRGIWLAQELPDSPLHVWADFIVESCCNEQTMQKNHVNDSQAFCQIHFHLSAAIDPLFRKQTRHNIPSLFS